MMWAGWAVAVASVIAVLPASAQVPFDGCYDRGDHPVAAVVRNDLGGYAGMATVVQGKPVIYWSDHAAGVGDKAFQVFLYLHECAHIRLRHVYDGKQSLEVEKEANCWAMQLMLDGGMLNGYTEGVLWDDIKNEQGDATHLTGEAAVASLQACLAARLDRGHWDVMLDSLAGAAVDSFKAVRGPLIREISPGPVYESRLSAPGVWDCDIVEPAELRCPLFAARTERLSSQRFKTMVKIIRKWLNADWTAAEKTAPQAGIAQELLAQDGRTGVLFTLAQTTAGRIWLLAEPTN
ncbi:MAG: hypothetical protein WBC97_05905 [Gemmatimonadales bacterium]